MKIGKNYKVIDKISETGENIIYKVRDEKNNSIVALKLLKNYEADLIGQFKKEYYILHTLSHPNIVEVYDIAVDNTDGNRRLYFTMEYIDGIPFNSYFLKNGYSEFIEIFLKAIGVLEFVHKRGYTHCDLKPGHIIVSKKGVLKLVDFGFAQNRKSIITDEVGGTLQYIAPEILKGEKPDVRTDIYSMGIIVYESLLGKEIFTQKKASEIISSVLSKNLAPVKRRKGIPDFVSDLVMKMTDKRRVNRFSNFESIVEIIKKKGKHSREERVIEKLLFSDFVGREEIITEMETIMRKVSKGEGQIHLVQGVTGTGKTRLLKEIQHRVFLDGKNVQYIRITNKGKFDFDWFLEFLEQSGENVDDIRQNLREGKYSLSGNEKYRFFEEITNRMGNLFSERISVLLIDDVDLTDKTMFDFFLYISVAFEKMPVLLVAATESIPRDLSDIIQIYDNISKEKLGGLNKREIVLFVKNMLGVTENLESLCNYLFEKTTGNPFFVEELLGEILAKGVLKKEFSRLIYNVEEIKKVSVPESIEVFVTERLRRISRKEQEILKILSVFGDSMPFKYLLSLSTLMESETASTLEMYALKQFISVSEDGNIDFTHRMVKNIIYKGIKKPERLRLHKKVLRFLESQKETSYVLHQKAVHSYIARTENAVLYLKRLLKKALETKNSEDAIDTFEKLKKLENIHSLFKKNRKLVLAIGNMYVHSGAINKVIKFYKNLLKNSKAKKDRCEVLHRYAVTKMYFSKYEGTDRILKGLLKEKLSLDTRFEVTTDLGWFYYSKRDYKKTEKLYEKSLKLSGKGLKKKVLPGKLYYNLCLLKQETGDFKQARIYANKVSEIGEKYKNRYYLILGISTLARLAQIRRNYEEAIGYYKKVSNLLDKAGDIPRRLNILTNLSRSLFSTGNIEESKKTYIEALDEAKKTGSLTEMFFLFNLYARILSRKGEWRYAIDWFDKSQRIARKIADKVLDLNNTVKMAIIFAFQGNSAKLEVLSKRALSLKKNLRNRKDIFHIDLLQGIKRYVAAEFKAGISYLSKLEDSIEEVNVPEYQIPGLLYKSLCLLRIDRQKQAFDSACKAEEIMQKTGMLLFAEEVEFTKLIIKQRLYSAGLRKKLENLLERTKKNQGFIHTRILGFLGRIMCEYALKTGNKKLLTESISLLKQARDRFQEMGAKVFLQDVTNALTDAYERTIELNTHLADGSNAEKIVGEFCGLIEHINNPEKLKDAFISMAKSITGAERGLFLSLDDDTGELAAASEDMDSSTIDDAKEFSRNVIKRVAETRKPLIAYDAVNDRDFDVYESVRINKIRSILCIPVVDDDRVLGALYLDSRKSPMLFSREEERFFSSLSTLLADSLSKALDYDRMKQQTSILKKTMRTRFGPFEIIGKSEEMQRVFDNIERFAETDVPVLILGETGTGKELVARTIHSFGKRKENSFLVVDCSAISASLLESELFGHKKGAFTGATEDKMGQFEAAKEGTIFIDEVANASESLQSRLLRFLDTQEVRRIGATNYRKIDARIIVASNRDLYKLVKKGKFSEDLYYRLSKFVLSLPPLRKRKEDIPLLVDYYIQIYNRKYSKNIKGITKEVQKLFIRYNWRGNIRELINEVARCVFFCGKSLISKEYLSENISRMKPPFLPLKDMKHQTESEYIRKALSFTNGNITKAARILKTDKKTIYRNLKKS